MVVLGASGIAGVRVSDGLPAGAWSGPTPAPARQPPPAERKPAQWTAD